MSGTIENMGVVQRVAESFGYLTEGDFCALYGITPGTAEAWRKRRTGPAYVLAGVNYLYPRSSIAADLEARQREPRALSPKELL